MFAAARAGAALQGRPCADVGQTAVKVVGSGGAVRIERDLERAPRRPELGEKSYAQASDRTLSFVAGALEACGPGIPLLALPCEFTEAGWPRESTYCWGDPERDFIAALEDRRGHPRGSLPYMNDAELAALAAPRGPDPIFVLTVGYGVGAAFSFF